MSSKIWFVLSEGQVTGPMEPDEVEEQVTKSADAQIWGRGHGEWMSIGRWRQYLKEQNPIAIGLDQSASWYLRVEGKQRPALTYSELQEALKSLTDYSVVDIRLGTDGEWKEIFAFQKVVDDLGISRRAYPRVPIIGSLRIESVRGDFTCRVISISEGGLGVTEAKQLQIGDRFQGTLTSPNLYVTISATCETVYVGGDGYAGIRFSAIADEFKSQIIEYVNKFATH